MNEKIMKDKILSIENKMWEAFSTGDSQSFADLVSVDALMICGGTKESGLEYSTIVSQVRINKYELSEFEVRIINPEIVLTNYVVKVDCGDVSISGKFRVSSIWKNDLGKWKLIFNQDSKILN